MKRYAATYITAAFALLVTIGGTVTARADRGVEGRGRAEYQRRLEQDLCRDQDRLHRLERLLQDELHCHDYTAARDTRFDILSVREDIDRDRRALDRAKPGFCDDRDRRDGYEARDRRDIHDRYWHIDGLRDRD